MESRTKFQMGLQRIRSVPPNACVFVLLASLAISSAVSQAAVIGLADAVNKTSVYNDVRDFADISGEASIYVVGTMTFDALDPTDAFDVVDVGVGGDFFAYQWGHQFNSDNFSHFFPLPALELDSSLSAGESHRVVLKFSQSGANAGDYSLWLDPDLLQTEQDNASVFDRTGGPTGTFEQIRYRGGQAGINTGVVDYTGFAIYTGADTPFAVAATQAIVPEPSTLLLAALGLSLLGRVARRRRSGRGRHERQPSAGTHYRPVCLGKFCTRSKEPKRSSHGWPVALWFSEAGASG